MARALPVTAALLLVTLPLTTLATAAQPTSTHPTEPAIFQASQRLVQTETEETNETHECGGVAPLKPICTTGLHVREGNSFKLGLTAVNYEGVLENRLEYDDGSRILRCVIDGASGTCELIKNGDFPWDGTRVLHVCQSEDLDTGLPGGSGQWSCRFVD